MNMTKNVLLIWVLILFLVTFTCSLTYLVAQQALRLGANSTPKQLATHTALLLDKGKSPAKAVSHKKSDLAKSLDPFVMVYSKSKKLLAASAEINHQPPSYPLGVLSTVQKNGEDRVTWQTTDGYRFATVVIPYKGGYIVAGQSLSETEKLIGNIGHLVLIAWIACFICSTVALFIIYAFFYKFKKMSLEKKSL